jgi:nitrous oxide reductase accessory protein NosL
MNSVRLASIAALGALSLAGCDRQAPDAPPAVRIGDSLCDQCNMIISDERWATATIVDGARGPEARLFDDFNCQVNHQIEHPDLGVVARWSHSHASSEWIRTEQARFLISPALRTPMGSQVAAFASADEARAAGAEFDGEIVTFDEAWARLGASGARNDTTTIGSPDAEKETPNAP